jgi:imidazolonepropionase-like amidohydrolase
VPRLFLTGPHLDGAGPAHPGNALVVRGAGEARDAVRRFAADGASAIKLYYRLPPAEMAAATREAHALGLPATAHLEIVDVTDALAMGVDGIEHITSFGTALAGRAAADAFRRGVLADNEYRRNGRYAMWAALDPAGPEAERLAARTAASGGFVVPTLAVFERRAGDPGADSVQVGAFRHMVQFTSVLHEAGVPLLVGSHSSVPHAPRGGAYLRELELLISAGLTPLEAIRAATAEAARAFRLEDRQGSVEVGKRADLLLVAGNPLEDIRQAGSVRGVMLNGVWVSLNRTAP